MTRKLPIRTDIQVTLFSEETETKYTKSVYRSMLSHVTVLLIRGFNNS